MYIYIYITCPSHTRKHTHAHTHTHTHKTYINEYIYIYIYIYIYVEKMYLGDMFLFKQVWLNKIESSSFRSNLYFIYLFQVSLCCYFLFYKLEIC